MISFPSIASFTFLWLQEDAVPVAAGPVAHSSALGDIVHNSGPVAFAVLLLLAGASVLSWTIMFTKFRAFAEAKLTMSTIGRPIDAGCRAIPSAWSVPP